MAKTYLERFEAFKQSGDLKELSEEGLAAVVARRNSQVWNGLKSDG